MVRSICETVNARGTTSEITFVLYLKSNFDILILLRQFPLLKIFLFIKDYIREIDQNYIQLKVAKTA